MATTCPVSRPDFATHAKPMTVTVTDASGKVVATHLLSPKEFSTGSLGFHDQGKVTVLVNGVPCTAQVNVMYTLIGSKDLPK